MRIWSFCRWLKIINRNQRHFVSKRWSGLTVDRIHLHSGNSSSSIFVFSSRSLGVINLFLKQQTQIYLTSILALRESTSQAGSIRSIRIANCSNPFSIIRSSPLYRPVLVMLGESILNKKSNTRIWQADWKIEYEISVDPKIKSSNLSKLFTFLIF